ncbi:MAG: CDP-alcohol phosphatidyltransferase family protein [Patescibacteria group bacterium]
MKPREILDSFPERSFERNMADSLTLARLVSTPFLTAHLLLKEPGERRWPVAGLALLAEATDERDGHYGRKAPFSKFSARFDQFTDKAFVYGQEGALTKNGELSPTHIGVKFVRDLVVESSRYYADKKGIDVSAGKLGKYKTTAEMTALVLAHSPLADNPDNIRRPASYGTALNILSGIDYLTEYLKDDKPKEKTESARNSKFREVFGNPIQKIVEQLDEKVPGLTPDHITMLGAGMVITAGCMLMRKPDKVMGPTLLYSMGSLMDALDGALARHQAEKNGVETTQEGMLKDLWADKIQEVFSLISASITERQNGNDVAADNYAIGAGTVCLTALFRALAESRGYVVPENGNGTRVIRGIEAGIGFFMSKNQDISDVTSATIASGNLITAFERAMVFCMGESSSNCIGANDDPKFKEDGKKKAKSLVVLAAGGLVAGSVALKYRGAK